MFYQILADALVSFHLIFIIFAVLGGILILWRRWFFWLHIGCAIWVCIVEFFHLRCPLTPLENQLRVLAGQQGYSGGFIEHYLIPIIYPAGLTQDLQMILGSLALLTNLIIYAWVYKYLRARQTVVQ